MDEEISKSIKYHKIPLTEKGIEIKNAIIDIAIKNKDENSPIEIKVWEGTIKDKKIEVSIWEKDNNVKLLGPAALNKVWVKNRGFNIENILEIPLVVDDKIQTIKKTARIYSILSTLGLEKELIKIKKSRNIRAGKGKSRGRKYKNKKGVLIVIKDDFGIIKASRNIPGTDVIKVENLSINALAPGGTSGRLILWTHSAFNELNNYEVTV